MVWECIVSCKIFNHFIFLIMTAIPGVSTMNDFVKRKPGKPIKSCEKRIVLNLLSKLCEKIQHYRLKMSSNWHHNLMAYQLKGRIISKWKKPIPVKCAPTLRNKNKIKKC